MDSMTVLMILHIAAVVIAFFILVAVRSNKEHIGILEALIAVLQEKLDIPGDTTGSGDLGDGAPK